MEKISFRVFDRHAKKIIYPKGAIFSPKFYETCNIETPNRYVLMLGSGIEDRNGKEIFAGDIVYSIHSCGIAEIRFGKFIQGESAVYGVPNNELMQYGFHSVSRSFENYDDDRECSTSSCGLFDKNDECWAIVVGNIYEPVDPEWRKYIK